MKTGKVKHNGVEILKMKIGGKLLLCWMLLIP